MKDYSIRNAYQLIGKTIKIFRSKDKSLIGNIYYVLSVDDDGLLHVTGRNIIIDPKSIDYEVMRY